MMRIWVKILGIWVVLLAVLLSCKDEDPQIPILTRPWVVASVPAVNGDSVFIILDASQSNPPSIGKTLRINNAPEFEIAQSYRMRWHFNQIAIIVNRPILIEMTMYVTDGLDTWKSSELVTIQFFIDKIIDHKTEFGVLIRDSEGLKEHFLQ